MTVSQKIIKILQEKGIRQSAFSDETGISPSTISDWKRKGTNPASDKILIICRVLDITPYELLADTIDGKYEQPKTISIPTDSEEYEVVKAMRSMGNKNKDRILGYARALKESK